MDQRLKEISENYEQMMIGPDDTFRFHCTMCGKCCVNREDIILNPYDMYRASKELGITPGDFFNKYCEAYIGSSSSMVVVRLLPEGPDKNRALAEIQDSAKGRLQRCIQSLLEMEIQPSPENIFYAVYCYEEERFPKIRANLSYRSEILTQDLPEHYAWELTDWAEILGSSVAETKLTVDYMKKFLADIIEEMTFFGSEQSSCEERIAVVKQSLLEAEESIRHGETVPEEEVFARFGLPRDEHDEAAAELSRKVTHAENEYNLYFRRREAARVRTLLEESK